MTERKELIDMLRYQTPLRVWFSDCEKYAYASAKNGCVIKVDADVAPLLHFCRPYVKARKYPNRTINYVTLSFGRATKYLHRVITCCPDDCEVDHKNGDTLDNTRENLRVVTHQENMQNPHSRRSSMTPMGVSLLPSGRFRAVRRIRGVTKHLGVFDTLDDALQAYEQAKGE